MKKLLAFLLSLVCVLSLAACFEQSPKIVNTTEGNIKTYYEMSDGTWKLGEYTYEYRLEISGKMPNSDRDITYVYLSNVKDITFQRAMMASGLSSHTADYFAVEDAVLVELNW
jgi:hypothetical protein